MPRAARGRKTIKSDMHRSRPTLQNVTEQQRKPSKAIVKPAGKTAFVDALAGGSELGGTDGTSMTLTCFLLL